MPSYALDLPHLGIFKKDRVVTTMVTHDFRSTFRWHQTDGKIKGYKERSPFLAGYIFLLLRGRNGCKGNITCAPTYWYLLSFH